MRVKKALEKISWIYISGRGSRNLWFLLLRAGKYCRHVWHCIRRWMSVVVCVSGRLMWFGTDDLLMAFVGRLIEKSPIDLLKTVFLWVTLLSDFKFWVMIWIRCRNLLWKRDLWVNWHWFDMCFDFNFVFEFFWVIFWYFAHFLCFVSMFLFSCIGIWVWIFTASFAIGFYGHLRWCSGMSFVMISTSSCGGMCMGILVNENFHWFLWSFVMSSVSWSVSWFRRIGCGMHMSFRMCIS